MAFDMFQGYTPNVAPSMADVQRRLALAKALDGTQIQNQGPLGALANVLNSGNSAYNSKYAADESQQGQDQATQALAKALGGGYAGIQADPGAYASAAGNPFLPQGASTAANDYVQNQNVLNRPVMVSSFDNGVYNPATGKYTPLQGASGDVIDSLVTGIENKTLPPDFSHMSTNVAANVRARLVKDGFDLTTGTLDYKGAGSNVSAINGVRDTNLVAALNTTEHTLDLVDDFAKQWSQFSTDYPAVNNVTLEAAAGGALIPILGQAKGQEAQRLAIQLKAQMGDSASEIGQMFKNGNTPTDQALAQGAEQLDAKWPIGVILNQTKMIRQNVKKRREGLQSASQGLAAGGAGTNPYLTQGGSSVQPGSDNSGSGGTVDYKTKYGLN